MKKSKMMGASLEQAMPMEHDHETEGHLRTLAEAADIMGDHEKLQKVHKLAGRKHKGVMGLIAPKMKSPKIKSLADLKAKASSMSKEPDEDDMV